MLLKLILFTQLFYPYIFGGGEYIFLLITKELVKNGHEVHVIAQKLGGTQAFDEFEGIKIHRVGPEVRSHGMLSPSIRDNFGYLLASIKKGQQIISQSKKEKKPVDIIHSNTYIPVLSGQLCSKWYKIPHVVTFHDVYQASNKKFWKDWAIKQDPDASFYTPIISKFLEKIIMKFNVSAFHTVSETSKEDLINFGVKKKIIHVIPNGLDSSKYQSSNSNLFDSKESSNPSIVFVGRLVFYKNVEIVIRALKKVIGEFPNIKLIVMGDGQHRQALEKIAAPLKDNVIFTGRISDLEKIKIIKSSSFMVFPSLVEGFGISIIEGFACKKPVLVSNIKPMSDIVKDGFTGYVLPSTDEEKWAEKIIELLHDTNKQKEMGNNAYNEFMSKYQINQIVSRIENLYNNIRKRQNP